MDLFGMYGSRDDAEHEQEAAQDQQPAAERDPEPGWAGYDGDDEETQPLDLTDHQEPAVEGPPPQQPQPERGAHSARDEQIERYVNEVGLVDSRRRLVRPYATTGGRTYSGTDLGLETMISVTGQSYGAVKMEHRMVANVCAQPVSVAEIAAHTDLPIGAARVVIADMIELNLLVICSEPSSASAPSVQLMNRVLSGLRRL